MNKTHFQLRKVHSSGEQMKADLYSSPDEGETFRKAGSLELPVDHYFDLLEILAKGGHKRCSIKRNDKCTQYIEGLVT